MKTEMIYAASTPVSGSTSIEKLACGIVFVQPLSATALVEMRSALNQLKDELPGQSEEHQMTASLMSGVPIEFAQLMGRGAEVHSRFLSGPDGVVKWRVTISQEFLTVECSEFGSKEDFFDKNNRYVSCILAALIDKQFNSTLRQIDFKIIDRFNYDTDFIAEKYSASEVFNLHSEFLPSNVSNRGVFWHVHQGWFEDGANSEHKLLQQLNIQNTENNPITKDISTVIEHQLNYQLRSHPLKISDLFDGNVKLTEMFNGFYEKNIDTKKKLLSAEKLIQIGIDA